MQFLKVAVVSTAAVALAAAAFVHAAAESDPLGLGLALNTDTSLSANALVRTADRASLGIVGQDPATGAFVTREMPPVLTQIARTAFEHDPLAAPAVRALALGDIMPGDEARGRRAMQTVWAISKRDDFSNLWLAMDAGQRQDLDETVSFFDASLRTSPAARGTAMPALVNMLVYPQAQEKIGALIKAGPDWEREFWRQLVVNPIGLQQSANFFRSTGLLPSRLVDVDRADLFENLRSAGLIGQLFQIASLEDGERRRGEMLAEGSFPATAAEGPLGWSLVSDGKYSSRIMASASSLETSARPDSNGVIAERVVRISSGQTLSLALSAPLPEGVTVAGNVTCPQTGGDAVVSVELAQGDQSKSATVPATSCEFGLLTLSFRTPPGRGETTFIVEKAALL